MTARHDLDRRLADYYASEAPVRAPDRVLATALADIESTPQRRVLVRVPWRTPNMPTYARLAVAAVAVIAVGLAGLTLLQPRSSPGTGGPGGSPSPSPPASPSPSPTPSAGPSPSPYVPPALTGTFSSIIHGISISYPEGWTTLAASEPWTTAGPALFQEPFGDFLYDPARSDHLFVTLASQPLAGRPADTWAADVLELAGCGPAEPVVVDGAAGLAGTDCTAAAVSIDERGYLILLLVSGDDLDLREFDATAWFDEILATVDLRPEDAVDTVP